MGVREEVEALIHRKPGLTQPEIAEEVLTRGARQQRVIRRAESFLKLYGSTVGGTGDPETRSAIIR